MNSSNAVVPLISQSQLHGPFAGWWEAARHPLMGIYLRLPRRHLPTLLARRVVIGLWGVWLGGTALAVMLYPQAAEQICTEAYSMVYCRSPLAGPNNPLYGVNEVLSWGLLLGLMVLLPLLFVGALLASFINGLRGKRPRSSQPNRLTLASAWDTGLMEELAITPLPPATLLRIRVLSRLHTARCFWAWPALGLGMLAAIGVGNAVVVPPYPEMGGWGNWLAQLGQVGLWGVALAVWLAALSVFAVLNEVTHGSRQVFPGVGWSALAASQFVVMIVTPLLVAMRLWARLQPFGDASIQWGVLLPLVVALTGVVMAGLNYALAQVIFHLRLRVLRR